MRVAGAVEMSYGDSRGKELWGLNHGDGLWGYPEPGGLGRGEEL